jgi:hypothetical protein
MKQINSRSVVIFCTGGKSRFVNEIRQSLGQAPGTLDIDEALATVSWQDGDHAQLAAVTAEDLLEEYKQQRITLC